jgi:hypothetical protein
MALLERLVHERNSLSPVAMEIAFGSLELPLGFL